jgi:endonuclease VIII
VSHSVPEGDTVWRTARSLDRALAGHILTDTDFRVPSLATVDLAGGRVRQTVSRGKHLLTHIDLGHLRWTLHTHLKMEGCWQIYAPAQRWRRPPHEARLVLSTPDKVAVGFALGIVELLPRSEEHLVVGHLGPDLLGVDWDEEEAVRRLSADPGRPLWAALLDQTNLAGIGTMYAAELCFTSGLHPDRPVGAVPDLLRLVRRAHLMLEANKERAVQATTGDLREGQRLWVHSRNGQPCRRCGTPIAMAIRGEPGRERAACWCPHCQPAEG